MTEERTPYDVGQVPPPTQAREHAHLFRVSIGGKFVIRFCEQCGKAWALSQIRDIISNRTQACWTEILEYEAARDRLGE